MLSVTYRNPTGVREKQDNEMLEKLYSIYL